MGDKRLTGLSWQRSPPPVPGRTLLKPPSPRYSDILSKARFNSQLIQELTSTWIVNPRLEIGKWVSRHQVYKRDYRVWFIVLLTYIILNNISSLFLLSQFYYTPPSHHFSINCIVIVCYSYLLSDSRYSPKDYIWQLFFFQLLQTVCILQIVF